MNDLLLAFLTNLSHLFGDNGLGWAILALSLAVRLALLPLTLGLAKKMLTNRDKVKALQPEIERIKGDYKDGPQQMVQALSQLYRARGVKLFDPASLLGALIQVPVFGLLYRSIRDAAAHGGSFLWIRSLASSNWLLTMLVLALTALASYYYPAAGEGAQLALVCLQLVVTGLFVWQLSAGLGLYWLGSALVSGLQSLLLRRHVKASVAVRPTFP